MPGNHVRKPDSPSGRSSQAGSPDRTSDSCLLHLAGLRWEDSMERPMAFSGPSLLWLGFFVRVPGPDTDGSARAVLLGFTQDPLELLVDLPANLGRGQLRPAGELDGGVRRGV